MKTKQIKLTIPSNLDEITLGQFQHWKGANELKAEDIDDTLVRKMAIHIFCKIPLNVVTRLSRQDFISVSNHVFHLLNPKEKPEIKYRFKLAGVEMGMIPDFSSDSLRMDEYVDLDMTFQNWQDMHKAMSILYRPVIGSLKGRYQIEPYTGSKEYWEAFKQVPLSYVLGAQGFFLTLGNELLKITPKYLQRLLKDPETKQKLMDLGINGDGINTSFKLLEGTCLNLMKLNISHSEKHLLSLRS